MIQRSFDQCLGTFVFEGFYRSITSIGAGSSKKVRRAKCIQASRSLCAFFSQNLIDLQPEQVGLPGID